MSGRIPQRLNRLLAEGEMEQQRIFYRVAGLLKSRDGTAISKGIRELSQLKSKPMWSKYLRSSLSKMKTLLKVKKQLLTSELPAVPASAMKNRMDGSELVRKIRNSSDQLVKRKYQKPAQNDYSSKRFVPSSVLTLQEKLKLVELPQQLMELLQRKISVTVQKTIQSYGEHVAHLTACGSKRNHYIQQVVQNTLVLQNFYRFYLQNRKVNPETLAKVRKQLCAVLAQEDFLRLESGGKKHISLTEHVTPAERADGLAADNFGYGGVFGELNGEVNEMANRFRQIISRIHLLNQRQWEQASHHRFKESILRKHMISKELFHSVERFAEKSLSSEQTRTENLCSFFKNMPRATANRRAASRDKLLCTTSSAVRPLDVRKANLSSMHCSRKDFARVDCRSITSQIFIDI